MITLHQDGVSGPLLDAKMRVLSLGAGVQSTTLALMAARGLIGPMPDCAIFADTQAEPQGVYDHLDWLERELPFPVYRVTAGDLTADILRDENTTGQRFASLPLHFRNADGTAGFGRRQCTKEYKIEPIERKVRELIGLKFRQRAPKVATVEQWIGISTDEIQRVKDSRTRWIRHRWPLVEARLDRQACRSWFAEHYPGRTLAKSACCYCPFRSNAAWAEIRADGPSWAMAVKVDNALRAGSLVARGMRSIPYVHRSLMPLEDVVFTDAPDDLFDPLGFANECEGMCGV